jgi:NAD+ synthase
MIIDYEKTANFISNWIKNYATQAGKKTLLVGLSGGVDSALTALLCKSTGIPTVCLALPCHSSPGSFERAKDFVKDYDLTLYRIDLSEAHNAIYNQIKIAEIPNTDINNPAAIGGMRSCLRPAVLSFFSHAMHGLIVGTGNRSEDNIVRYYQKFGDGCVDISPIGDLFKSEVYELFGWLGTRMKPNTIHVTQNSVTETPPPSVQEIFTVKPTADLLGPDAGQEDEKELGMSYDEIEWADREEQRTRSGEEAFGIIFSNDDPAKRPDFFRYTARQQAIIAKLNQVEKLTRHKVNYNLPVCNLRQIEGLVR